jgi:prepilin-type N-terminal cleavage/methylation domain-containing protein/prepilin-type processing-associated H-X9-DG protein
MIRLSSVRGPRSGFTLIELLVVIVIIATLATLGFLGARAAITSSHQSACAANLRNLGAALHLYAQDHGGSFPETTHTTTFDRAWVYLLEAYLGDFEKTRVCPADPQRAARLEAKGTSYLLNSFIFVPEVDPWGELVGPVLNRPDAIPEPSHTIIAFICSDSTATGPDNDHTHSREWASWTDLASNIAPGRFGGGGLLEVKGRSNYLYVDGRVESMTAAEVKRKLESGINIAKPPGTP